MSSDPSPEGQVPSSAGIRLVIVIFVLSNSFNLVAATIMESTPAVESSPQIWSICLSHADKFDRALVETWKGDMDGILIFVGVHIDIDPLTSAFSHTFASPVFSLQSLLHSSSLVTRLSRPTF